MHALLLTAVLAQSPQSLLVPEWSSPRPEVVAVEPQQVGRSQRLAASFAGALLGGGLSVGVMAAIAAFRPPNTTSGWGFVSIASMPVTVGLGAWAGHALAGGKSTPQRGLAGGFAATGLAAAAFVVAGDNGDGPRGLVSPRKRAENSAITYGLALLPGILFTTWLLEYGHARAIEDLQVGVVPLTGGAAVSVGGAW